MTIKTLGLAALAGVMMWTATPAQAEFFGCNDAKVKVSYSNGASRQAFSKAHQAHASAHPAPSYKSERSRSAGLFAPYHARSQPRW